MTSPITFAAGREDEAMAVYNSDARNISPLPVPNGSVGGNCWFRASQCPRQVVNLGL